MAWEPSLLAKIDAVSYMPRAVGEMAVLPNPPLPAAGVSIGTERGGVSKMRDGERGGCQHNDRTLADGGQVRTEELGLLRRAAVYKAVNFTLMASSRAREPTRA